MKLTVRTYGEGGYNPDLPDDNLIDVEEVEVADDAVTTSVADVREVVATMDAPQAIRDALDSVLARVADAAAAGNLNTDPPTSA